MASPSAPTATEELALWEYNLFGGLQPSTYLAATGTESTTVSAPDGRFQVNQSHYIPEGLDQLTPDGVAELPPGATYTKDEEHGWFYGQALGVSTDQMQQFKDMLLQHKGAFAYSMKELPGYNGPPAEFTMVPNARAFHKRRQYSPLEKEIQEEKCAELLEAGFIIERDTRSDFAACPTMPAKKDELGHWTDRRFCQDYRDVNTQMVADNHPLPLPEELFRSLKGAKYLSKIDMRSGFLQIPIHPDSQHVTAFWWGSRLFQYTRVPFGIKTSVAIFQRVMETVIQRAGLTHCAHVYVDDILVHSKTFSEHIEHVAALLQALHAADLRAHPAKSVWVTDRVEYLGHMVTPDGMEPVAAKVAAMANLPVPKNKDDLRKALGLLNYYRNYIVNCSATAKPLSDLLCKNAPFVWGDAQQQAFEALKAALCTPGLVLKHPRKDRPFILHTDWSTCGISAVLGQLDEQNQEYMVACISRSLNEHERKYEAWKGELLAGVWGMKSYRVYLHGRDFEIVTDHRPLLWLLTAPNPTGQQARWILSLQEYDFTIRHRPGSANVNADVPSRFPLPTTVDVTGARLDSGSYNGPLPKVVFGPVGTGTPVQPYRLEDAPPELQLEPAYTGLDPAHLLATMAHVSLVNAARYDQFLYLQAPSIGFLDEYDCRPLDLWETSCGAHLQPLVDTGAPVDRIQQELLRRRATQWVQQVGRTAPLPPSSQAGRYVAPADDWGVKQTLALCTASVSSTYHTAAAAGIVLCELFGGICAGLEMVLRNGIPVHTYIYVDHDPVCQAVARHRISQLMAQFPHLLPATAVEQTFSALPSDVWQITSAHLAALTARLPRQWLVVGGWACQDLSPAGPCTGIQGSRSNTFYPLLQIIGALQQLQQRLPPAYLIENTAFQHNWKSQDISRNQYQQVCSAIGSPVCLDAAQFDSYAHRLRNYWTNLCDHEQLLMAAAQVTRSPNLQVQDILSPGRQANACGKDDRPPYYMANVKGEPLSALPTIVAYPGSYAFRPGEPGAIYDANKGQWSEPTADECERAMGYATGTTAAADVTEQQRRTLMGRCMDANVLQSLYAISLAWYRLQHWAKAPLQLNVATYNTVLPKSDDCAQDHGVAACFAALPSSTGAAYTTIRQVILTTTAEVSDQQQLPSRQALDVWEDEQLLYYLKEQQYKPDTSNSERTRVRKRAALYVLAIDGRLFRVLADGSQREVPKPEQRHKIITDFHEQCGHYGVRRTAALVQTAYWWHGVLADVADIVSKCNLCGRVRSSFNAVQPTLNPLPINGMFYRAGCDLAGPFNKTARGAVYVMVVIEYHSKFLTIIPIPDKRPSTTAAAFAQHILGRYGSFAEVVTDRGTEWGDEFAQLLCDVMIDHRRTSAGHPEADGLCERAVQTAKRALRKLCAQRGHKDDWDLMVPFVMLGYNCSPQKSTGLPPYMLMYARVPTVPPAIRERLSVPVDFGSQEQIEAAAADYLQRAELVKRLCIIAGDNLRIAQHRDTLRYAAVRSGSYVPKLKRFEVGDYVYVSRAPQTTLTIKARPVILRVKEVRSSGVLNLEGRCGRTVAMHISKCAPCHLPDIDPRIDPTLAAPDESVQCETCHSADDEEYMLLCDKCNRATHLYCAVPPLEAVPPGIWLCSDCLAQGFTASQVEQQRSQDLQLELQQQRSDDLTPAQKRAKQLHGRLVVKTFNDESTNLPRPFWGKLYFVGPGQGPNLLVQYEDQDSETCTLQTMRRKGIKLMPEGTELPAGVRIPEPVAASVLSQQLCSTALSGGSAAVTLPTHWDLQTRQGVARALSILMPGEYAPLHLTKIANSVKAILMDSRHVWVPTVDTELEPLARLVDFSACHSFLDPFAGSGSIAAFFASMGYQVLQNDLNLSWPVDLHCDALQPAFYAAHPAQVIVASPPFCVLDIAVPLMSLAASVVACIHVPGHWLSSATKPRQQWLQEMFNRDRLHVILGLERGPMGRKCAFLLVFATADMKAAMMRAVTVPRMLSFAQVNK